MPCCRRPVRVRYLLKMGTKNFCGLQQLQEDITRVHSSLYDGFNSFAVEWCSVHAPGIGVIKNIRKL